MEPGSILADRYRVGETLGKRLGGHNVDYAQFDTSAPMDAALFKFLGARSKFERARKVG